MPFPRLVVVFAGFLLAVPPAFAELRYQVINLGTLGGGYSDASAINDRGWVVGVSAIPTGQHRAYLWRDGVMVELGVLPGGQHSEANAINNAGWVVGTSQPGRGRAVLWRDGQMTDLGRIFGGLEGVLAFGVNHHGQIVGSAVTDFQAAAWIWQDGILTRLFSPGSRAGASAINDFSQIAGWSNFAPGDPFPHAVLWSGGVLHDLGTLGGPTSGAYGLNNLGCVVGDSETAGDLTRAFLWHELVGMHDLGVLPGHLHSVAKAVNDRGQVVGYSWADNPLQGRAFLWQEGEMVDLNTRIPPGSGWQLTFAFGINNRGHIVGLGSYHGQGRGFLLRPLKDRRKSPSASLRPYRP